MSNVCTPLFPPHEFDQNYAPPPFNHTYDTLYWSALYSCEIELRSTLLQNIHEECDLNGEPGDTDKFLHFPPSIYHTWLPIYPYRVYCSKRDTSYRIWDLRCIRAQANAIINAIHAFLMPQQAGECLRQDISILVADGNLCAPVILHRGEFFQHIAPSANPFFMIEEASYICMAMHGYTSILQYYWHPLNHRWDSHHALSWRGSRFHFTSRVSPWRPY